MATLSIIVPLYNEAEQAAHIMAHLLMRRCADEIILVDASDDARSIAVIDDLVAQFFEFQDVHILRSEARGRAQQMNVGASKASSDVLLFLHADTTLPEAAENIITAQINSATPWGRFKVKLDANGKLFALIAYMINLRSKWRDLATGDQAIVVKRDVFAQIGGFKEMPIMEDVEISRRLAQLAPPILFDAYVTTSARRWQKFGVVKTILLMWSLRFLYWLRIPVPWLAKLYRYE